ncbi:hypothetical protein ccbrp13_03390 [Ktedonobacteria bacterium brp13]|nr:hypothetical protein ccbrp13_03390 [Ktedonobacteria bacterium brp13]
MSHLVSPSYILSGYSIVFQTAERSDQRVTTSDKQETRELTVQMRVASQTGTPLLLPEAEMVHEHVVVVDNDLVVQDRHSRRITFAFPL